MTLELDNCCCCGELRTGSLIFGYLSLIRDIIVILISLILLLTGVRMTADVTAVIGVMLLMGILNIIFTTVLLVGIHQYKNQYMKAYLIFNLVTVVIFGILIFIICILTQPAFVILGLFFLIFHVYYLLVIRSYYMKMDDPMKKPAIFNTPEGPPLMAEHLPA